jgi:hypothetical protein
VNDLLGVFSEELARATDALTSSSSRKNKGSTQKQGTQERSTTLSKRQRARLASDLESVVEPTEYAERADR